MAKVEINLIFNSFMLSLGFKFTGFQQQTFLGVFFLDFGLFVSFIDDFEELFIYVFRSIFDFSPFYRKITKTNTNV